MSGIQGSMVVVDTVSPAFQRYANMRAAKGKGLNRTIRNVMKMWVSFAYAAIKKDHAGKPQQIDADLKKIVSHGVGMRKAKGKSADEYRGTLAARLFIFFAKDPAAASALRGAAFYSKVRAFANTRRASAGVHAAGMFPAMRALRTPTGPSRFKNPPGNLMERTLDDAAEILAENWASGRQKRSVGIAGLVPDAFTGKIAELEAALEKILLEEVKNEARAAGLTVDP